MGEGQQPQAGIEKGSRNHSLLPINNTFFRHLFTSTSSAGMLMRDLTGRTGTHRGLAEKECWN
jgi:hypothetical protein